MFKCFFSGHNFKESDKWNVNGGTEYVYLVVCAKCKKLETRIHPARWGMEIASYREMVKPQ